MSTQDPNWGDDDFDSPDNGFMPRKPKVADPVSAYVNQGPPPQITPPKRSSSPKSAIIFLLLFVLTAIGFVVFWVSKPPTAELVAVSNNKDSNRSQEAVRSKTQVPDSAVVSEKQPDVDIAVSRDRAEANIALHSSRHSVPSDVSHRHTGAVVKDCTVTQTAVIPPTSPKTNTARELVHSANQIWCVQVFATTSADDADEWVARLRSKNAEDSRIEMFNRQGQVWYRVRFGRFNSQLEAESSARSLGFRNGWVSRIQ